MCILVQSYSLSHTYTHSLTHSHTHIRSLTYSLTHSLTHSRIHVLDIPDHILARKRREEEAKKLRAQLETQRHELEQRKKDEAEQRARRVAELKRQRDSSSNGRSSSIRHKIVDGGSAGANREGREGELDDDSVISSSPRSERGVVGPLRAWESPNDNNDVSAVKSANETIASSFAPPVAAAHPLRREAQSLHSLSSVPLSSTPSSISLVPTQANLLIGPGLSPSTPARSSPLASRSSLAAATPPSPNASSQANGSDTIISPEMQTSALLTQLPALPTSTAGTDSSKVQHLQWWSWSCSSSVGETRG